MILANGTANPMRTARRAGAFTLIELLVVVTIIVLLLALLLPSMNHAIGLAEDLRCRNNLSQLGKALISAGADNFQIMPASTPGYGAPAGTKVWIGSEIIAPSRANSPSAHRICATAQQ